MPYASRLPVLTAAIALALGGPAMPAGASPPTDVIAFSGTAATSPVWAPLFSPGGGLIEEDGTWSFNSSACVTVLQGECDIDASGILTHAFHGRSHPLPDGTIEHRDVIGPFCGASQGDDGTGTLAVGGLGNFPPASFNLSDLGWIVSAGGSLLVTGDVSGLRGSFLAYVQAQGGLACIEPGGATEFTVVGTAWALFP